MTNLRNDSSKTELYQTAREQLVATTHESVLMPTEGKFIFSLINYGFIPSDIFQEIFFPEKY